MLHMMLERGEAVHSAVFFDTGWEFHEMAEHIDLVERKTGIKVVRLHPKKSFDYWMRLRPIIARVGPMKGKLHRLGNGWPSPMRRWCTREKVETIGRYQNTVPGCVPCIGYGADEQRRVKPGPQRYPLIEYGVSEADALAYCRRLGYQWGGLYDIFRRVSCWCCPLQSLRDLRLLRKHRPELWAELLRMDAETPEHNPGFKDYRTARELDARFAREGRQMRLPFSSAGPSVSMRDCGYFGARQNRAEKNSENPEK
jgi:3'-phosphoadenosine 5'-phosphosulfate sulfotransferase (PAPS reductase)/FAD synthetase